MKAYLFFLFLIVTFSCCTYDPCRFIDDPIYTYGVRILEDSSENDLLFGDHAIYDFDSIEYSNPNILLDLYKVRYFNSSFSDTLLTLEIFEKFEESYFLKFGNNDIDTLNIKTVDLDEDCYTFAVDSIGCIAVNRKDYVKYESPFVIWK